MTNYAPADTLHRLVKHALDSGAADSIASAEAMFRGYRINLEIQGAVAFDAAQQATLLTAVALAHRVFLGGVSVRGALDVALAVPMPLGLTLADAVQALGAALDVSFENSPTIVVGGGPSARRDGFCVRTAAVGWRGGVLPIHSELIPTGPRALPLSGMLAAALAINEAYWFASGRAPSAGRRVVGLSLWRPGADVDWLAADAEEPALQYLPSRLWLIGLGHLGQAYLWALGLMPYRDPSAVSLVLQDVDVITPSTHSTSILTTRDMAGQKKTRAMATWAERRGFIASIQERLFAADFKRQPDEPVVALCGLDNAEGRRALDQVGFDLIVEAGLGRGHQNFRTMRLHTLPGPRRAADLWGAQEEFGHAEERAAYQSLLATGDVDRCGMTLLAGKAVGAPFVGATAAALALAEVLRLLHGEDVHELIDLDLLCPDQLTVSRQAGAFRSLNPGFLEI